MARRFWWASQGKNYEVAVAEGTLWAPLLNDGGVGRPDWLALMDMRPSDVVLHYDAPYLSAVSVVVTTANLSYPPVGYKAPPRELGNLVLVQPLTTEIAIHRDTAATIVPHGNGPLTIKGKPAQKYVSNLSEDVGTKLLELANIDPSKALRDIAAEEFDEPLLGGSLEETDILVLANQRAEQRFLRTTLLRSFPAQCAMCHRMFPENLPVAGHIKPRRACSHEERLDYINVAMLVCVLGCDSLYEKGYLGVDSMGRIVIGSGQSAGAANGILSSLADNQCLRHNEKTGAHFAWHYEHTFLGS